MDRADMAGPINTMVSIGLLRQTPVHNQTHPTRFL